MAQINYINYLREKEGLSINSLANRLGINWRTAKKYADRDDWNPDMEQRTKRYPSLAPYLEIIEAWLTEDLLVKRKERHTNVRIFRRLRDECGYTGGVRTVTSYASKRKKELTQEQKTYTELIHPGGEAQVDFGTTDVIYEGTFLQVKYLILSFPYSNAGYLVVFPRETVTCFLEGLKTLFNQIGGVPHKIWFDNLSAAVLKTKNHGERDLTNMFQRFKLHYRFEAVFCNPRAGHEKGNVENKVGTNRRNWFVPSPVMKSWEQINQLMKQKADEYLEHEHYKYKRSIRSLWEEEQSKLLKLPRDSFEVVQLETAKLDKYGDVRFDKKSFSVPGGSAHQPVALKIYWDRLEVIDDMYKLMAVLSRPHSLKQQDIDWVQRLEQVSNKPRAVPYTLVYSALPKTLQRYLNQTDLSNRKQRTKSLIQWLHDGYCIDQIGEAVAKTPPHLQDERGVIYQELYRTIHPETADHLDKLEESYTPPNVRNYEPVLEVYDTLTEGAWS